jgi:hypothetical protein
MNFFIGVDLHKKIITVCVMDGVPIVTEKKTTIFIGTNVQRVGEHTRTGRLRSHAVYDHSFRTSPTNSNTALVPGSSGTPRSPLILL